jgi:hypothetical protein
MLEKLHLDNFSAAVELHHSICGDDLIRPATELSGMKNP